MIKNVRCTIRYLAWLFIEIVNEVEVYQGFMLKENKDINAIMIVNNQKNVEK